MPSEPLTCARGWLVAAGRPARLAAVALLAAGAALLAAARHLLVADGGGGAVVAGQLGDDRHRGPGLQVAHLLVALVDLGGRVDHVRLGVAVGALDGDRGGADRG